MLTHRALDDRISFHGHERPSREATQRLGLVLTTSNSICGSETLSTPPSGVEKSRDMMYVIFIIIPGSVAYQMWSTSSMASLILLTHVETPKARKYLERSCTTSRLSYYLHFVTLLLTPSIMLVVVRIYLTDEFVATILYPGYCQCQCSVRLSPEEFSCTGIGLFC